MESNTKRKQSSKKTERKSDGGQQSRYLTKEKHSVSHQGRHLTEDADTEIKGNQRNMKNEYERSRKRKQQEEHGEIKGLKK